MLGGRDVKAIYELHGQGHSVRAIARQLGISRNSVRKYLRSPGIPTAAPRQPRAAATGVWLRVGAELVAGALRGVRAPRRRGDLYPVPSERLRVPGRRAAAL